MPLSLNEVGSAYTTFSYPVPEGLEGPYRIHLRTTDENENLQSVGTVWEGEIDTVAPEPVLNYFTTANGTRLYFCNASDYNITPEGLTCPFQSGLFQAQAYQEAAWYTELFSDTTKLYTYGSGTTNAYYLPNDPSTYTVTACDSFDNCATVGAVASNDPPPPADLGVSILAPATQSTFSDTTPLALSGTAQATNFLQTLDLQVNETIIDSQGWSQNDVTEAEWASSWTPTADGIYTISATLTDWAGQVITDGVTISDTLQASTVIYVDQVPPEVTLTTDQIGGENFSQSGFITLEGLVTDTIGIASLQVRLNEGAWQEMPNPVSGAWQMPIYSGSDDPPDGEQFTIEVQARDYSGNIASDSLSVWADLVAPSPFTPTLTYLDSNGISQPITMVTTIDDVYEPTLTVNWSASSDGSGVAGYKVEWLAHLADGSTEILQTLLASEPQTLSYTTSELQKLSVRMTASDTIGNERVETIGPFYIDHGYTPVFVSWDEFGEPYRGWTESSCNLLGTDNRMAEYGSTAASMSRSQSFYTTWDENGLRLAWKGANWRTEGDLFIYFDTTVGGSDRLYNPYPVNDTIIILPAQQNGGTLLRGGEGARGRGGATATTESHAPQEVLTIEQMAADYMIWVQESITETNPISATLMAWNSATESWQEVEANDQWLYNFTTDLESPQTDIYLPFSLLGIDNPAEASLRMTAFASEQEALRLWATMPPVNSVNSALISNAPVTPAIQQIVLNNWYEWPSLDSNICPSGVAPALPQSLPTLGGRQEQGENILPTRIGGERGAFRGRFFV